MQWGHLLMRKAPAGPAEKSLLGQFRFQPGAREEPVRLDGAQRNGQCRRDFRHRQPAETSHLDDLRLACIEVVQPLQGRVEIENRQGVRLCVDRIERSGQSFFAGRIAFLRMLLTGVVDEHLPHDSRT